MNKSNIAMSIMFHLMTFARAFNGITATTPRPAALNKGGSPTGRSSRNTGAAQIQRAALKKRNKQR